MTPAEAYAQCERITWAAARNFAYGIRLLPGPKRRAMAALYAMARRIDDVSDGSWPQDRKLQELGRLHRVVSSIEAGVVENHRDPVLVAVADAARRFPIPVEALHEIVEGGEMDARGVTYVTMEDTVRYCRLVAGSVGRLSLGVFGIRARNRKAVTEERVSRMADDLGVALQLTNILRDIAEDLEVGRIYLPEQVRERFGVLPDRWAPREAVGQVVEHVSEDAVAWFDQGLTLLHHLDHRSRSCTAAMAGIYRRLLLRIRAQPELPLSTRVGLPTWEKGLVAARSLVGLPP